MIKRSLRLIFTSASGLRFLDIRLPQPSPSALAGLACGFRFCSAALAGFSREAGRRGQYSSTSAQSSSDRPPCLQHRHHVFDHRLGALFLVRRGGAVVPIVVFARPGFCRQRHILRQPLPERSAPACRWGRCSRQERQDDLALRLAVVACRLSKWVPASSCWPACAVPSRMPACLTSAMLINSSDTPDVSRIVLDRELRQLASARRASAPAACWMRPPESAPFATANCSPCCRPAIPNACVQHGPCSYHPPWRWS